MAKKTSKSNSASRKGKVPPGWTQISFQVPKGMAKMFRDFGASSGHGGGKLLGTAAIAFVNSLSSGDRKLLMKYVKDKTWMDPEELEIERINTLIRMILKDDDTVAPVIEPVWYVDKIMDPELTPEPGKKQSDKQRPDEGQRRQGG